MQLAALRELDGLTLSAAQRQPWIGFEVSDAVRQHELGCQDPSTLERWPTRAITASSDAEAVAA